jgi:glycosyltransferase involved in cell wall biosynthesis
MKSKITFVVPSVNRITLKRALHSLVLQTDPNWKCIVIYDGVDGPKFSDDRIRTIKINKTGSFGPIHGLSGLVRNEGLKLCDTEWIGFLDDDDSLNKEYVSTLHAKYTNHDFVVWRMRYTSGMILPPSSATTLIFGQVGISFCYRNKFNDLFFENNRDGEDFDFIKKLTCLTNNYVIAPEVFYNVGH